MWLLRGLTATFLVMCSAQAPAAQDRDISGPLQALKANVNALALTHLNHNGVDQRLALEIQLRTDLPVPASLDEVKRMSPEMQKSILAVCSRMMMPMVENLNDIGGFPNVSGVRITLQSKPTTIGPVGAGTYQTLIFPQDRGCDFGW